MAMESEEELRSAIEEAKALSLVTAHEDNVRRRQKYGHLLCESQDPMPIQSDKMIVDMPHVSEPVQYNDCIDAAAKISRPRPRTSARMPAAQTVISVPVQYNRPPQPRVTSLQDEKCLIKLSPPKPSHSFDFDLSDLDPLKNGSINEYLQKAEDVDRRLSALIDDGSNIVSSDLSKFESATISAPSRVEDVVRRLPHYNTLPSNGSGGVHSQLSFSNQRSVQTQQSPSITSVPVASSQSSLLPLSGSPTNSTSTLTSNSGSASHISSPDSAVWTLSKPSSPITPQRSTSPRDHAIVTEEDLMAFPSASKEQYLCLESFDPLFGVSESVEGEASAENSKFSTTPSDPVPPQLRVALPPIENKSVLQDPFSLDNLTQSLEEKRKEHASVQAAERAAAEERELLSQKERENSTSMKVVKSGTQHQVIGTPGFCRSNSLLANGKDVEYEMLIHSNENLGNEVGYFCNMVALLNDRLIERLKRSCSSYDQSINHGVVISPRLLCPIYRDMTVKLVVYSMYASEPIVFTCDLNTTIEHVIIQVMLSLTDNLGSSTADDYIIKVHGRTDYLINDSTLGEYVYVQECLKLDADIRLLLFDRHSVKKSLLRTAADDNQPVYVPKTQFLNKDVKVTCDNINIVLEAYYKEVERLRDRVLQRLNYHLECNHVVQSVKALCSLLCRIETVQILKAIQQLHGLLLHKNVKPSLSMEWEAYIYVSEDGSDFAFSEIDKERFVNFQDLHVVLERLTQAVKNAIELYCRAFMTDFRFLSASHSSREKRMLTGVRELFVVHVASCHRIPAKWCSQYEDFRIQVGMYHCGSTLAPEITTQTTGQHASFDGSLIWDEWVQFDQIINSHLPREARICFTLVGIRTVPNQSGSSECMQKINSPLGWVSMLLFSHKSELVQGSQLLGFWPGDCANPCGTVQSNHENPNSVLLQVNFQTFDSDVCFPSVDEVEPCSPSCIPLSPADSDRINDILKQDILVRLSPDDTQFLWRHRASLTDRCQALPRLLRVAPSWSYYSLRENYSLLEASPGLSPYGALQFLMPCYGDVRVRTQAVEWLSVLSHDELVDFLPQLVQALKFESYHNSSLSQLLLKAAVSNLRVAHALYWLLKEAAEDFHYWKRYQLMFGALLSVVGKAMRDEFSKQDDFVKMIASIASKVKAAKDKEAVLQRELENMWDFLEQDSLRLPLDPSMEINGVDAKSCSYFTSNAFPLKLVFRNIDLRANDIYVMFKAGDDLRQDMLVMQLVRVMDRLWLREGLDLRLITFQCQATGPKKGLVELVTESETLRRIQVKQGHGLAGSFKDRPIAEWLQIQNPTELDYQKAVDNFVASCAGYCVATYILGIGDRHNDNIMIKQSGHLFHIDFGKFLGDAQMFGSIKRDRTPFVLTSDMAYVINGGERGGLRFQRFVDLCCAAFNILRRHSDLFLNLFVLMLQSGIPGVTEGAARYVQKALLPELTNVEATAHFTKMIKDSLKSLSTPINFFFHNLAQLKFSGHTEGALLSFIPRTYSIDTDGAIRSVEMYAFQKRYSPEKHYIYIIKIHRENQRVPSYIFRRYSEVQELQHKLRVMFPLARLPCLMGRVYIGRTHVKHVAEVRKTEIDAFLQNILKSTKEIAECDLIYTFFHPMLRDEQDVDKTNLSKIKEPSSPERTQEIKEIRGQIKLSLFYRENALNIMVMHAKDLCCSSDGVNPYVKIYLQPDPMKITKKKTRVVRGTAHPTFNQLLHYPVPIHELKNKTLQVTVWGYNTLDENEFLGALHIHLNGADLSSDQAHWFKLHTLHSITT